ncbi:hypothetical protein QYM36_014278 [Artemia franciscana]|uniref:Uncharacterized protein n=1 Tax=Artemia franciscana TaxID=6661 RepID=A0AA88HPU2_ARTSF|nr:hypothetical protein QYM36_014278 [Artemia franciscana]
MVSAIQVKQKLVTRIVSADDFCTESQIKTDTLILDKGQLPRVAALEPSSEYVTATRISAIQVNQKLVTRIIPADDCCTESQIKTDTLILDKGQLPRVAALEPSSEYG